MRSFALKNSLLLFLAACIWGVAFVAQSVGMDYMGPLFFNGVRFLLGGMVLLPLVAVRKKAAGRMGKRGRTPLLTGGVCCGLALCAASICQQIGIQFTTVGKAGFITTLYIIIVPVLGLFFHRKAKGKVWAAALLAASGFYLLCMAGGSPAEGLSLGRGDLFMLACAFLFSVHILIIDYFSPRVDGVELSCFQFFVAGLVSMALALVLEQPSFGALRAGLVPVLYAGVLSCGVAYTLQIVGQKGMDPAVASLILSLESVVSVLAGWVILGQRLSGRELAGCALVFAAVILVQLKPRGGAGVS